MSTSTSSGTGIGTVVVVAAIAVVILLGGGHLYNTMTNGDDDQSFVDLEATWSPDRAMVITWSIGNREETVFVDDSSRFGTRQVANKGQVARLHVAPVDDDGTTSCMITINERLADEDQSTGLDACFVEARVP